MACTLANGRIVDCADSVGGINRILISAEYKEMTTNAAFVVANDTISAIGAQVFYTFELRPELSSLTVNYQADKASGTTFFEQVLSCTFQNLDVTDIIDIKALCQGRPNIWVLDNMNKCWLIGAKYGCNVSGGNLQTGTAFGDMNGFTIDFTAREENPIFLATASIAGVAGVNYPLDAVTNATVNPQPS